MRLAQGRYDAATVYDADPAAAARRFAAHAVPRLHVVDLDGARAGRPQNGAAVRAIVAAVGALPVQLGGGLRDLAAVEAAFAHGRRPRRARHRGAARPRARARRRAPFPGPASRSGSTRWTAVSRSRAGSTTGEATVIEVAKRFEDAGVAALVHTDIARDGMLAGPNLDASAELADAVSIPVIVSGGIASEDDLVAAARLRRARHRRRDRRAARSTPARSTSPPRCGASRACEPCCASASSRVSTSTAAAS